LNIVLLGKYLFLDTVNWNGLRFGPIFRESKAKKRESGIKTASNQKLLGGAESFPFGW